MRSILPYITLALSTITSATPISTRPSVAQFALQKVLHDASPIFGDYVNPKDQSATENWMKKYPDSTMIVHMNLPGVHDAATWNYSHATQDSLKHITDLNGGTLYPPQIYRCQESPFISMLNSGIRVFDLRFAFDATDTDLVFYHGAALQSESTTVEDVLFGFYQWLNDHPYEALFTSFQYEGGTKKNAANNVAVQRRMFDTLTSSAARKYFVQTKGELGTLGQARGKITLFRRFDLDKLPSAYEDALPGLHFPPSLWFDNDPDIALTYNPAKNLTAYIEDFYETGGPIGSSAAFNIELKYNATVTHLNKAASEYPKSLFWTWASSEYNINVPSDTPRIMALGNGTELTPLGGVNERLLRYLKSMHGKRLGIVMFDFFDTPGDLVETLLDL
jgi:1-phosphatidylinositol phosphodiesterase